MKLSLPNALFILISLIPCWTSAGIELYVSPAGGHVAPFTDWATAATNIQAAIDAAETGDVVWVTNGVYATGGRVMSGSLTNRVVVDKALTVRSVNGSEATTIQGQWDPAGTNGPAAIRCAWVTNGAVLNGFTLTGGATLGVGSGQRDMFGGGVWCFSPDAVVANCIISGNSAWIGGGGSWNGTLVNCAIKSNAVITVPGLGQGGGAYCGVLSNCVLTANYANAGGGYAGDTSLLSVLDGCAVFGNEAATMGGGAQRGSLKHCTVSNNKAPSGGGVMQTVLSHCVLWANRAKPGSTSSNYSTVVATYTCATPLIAGEGNLAVDPQLVDAMHLAVTSPCRGAGSATTASGTDIDRETWSNPPSVGCDEVWEADLVGPLAVDISTTWPAVAATGWLPIQGRVSGRASRAEWLFDDGSVLTNGSYAITRSWEQAGDYPVTFTAFNSDHPEGVSTTLVVHVVPLAEPRLEPVLPSGGYFLANFFGQPGATYVLDWTANLTPPVVWTKTWSDQGADALLQAYDKMGTNQTRFYRLRTQ